MQPLLKRVQSIGIILILMLVVYEYAETTVIYQTVMIADQEDIGQDAIATEQMNQQMVQMAIEGVYIMQTMINKPYKIVYLKEIPECGDNGLKWAKDYIAYKDLLVLGGTVFKRQDGTYRPTDQTLSGLTKIEEPYPWRAYSQCENMIVALDENETAFLVYDMDTAETCSYPCGEGRIIDGTNWCVYGGEIYYVECVEDNDGSWIRDTTIRKMDPHNGDSVEFYRGEKPGLDSFWFFIREDGTIFFEWVEWGERFADRREYWKIQPNADGTWEETKLCEIDRWKFREFGGCNEYGFFILGQYFEPTNESLFERIVIKDNGETETPVLVGEGWRLYCGNGYLVENMPQQEKGSVTFYDYHGNVINTWQLIEEDDIEKGYELVNLLYYDGTITGFYQQESTKELYITQIDAELER